jgi:hypothetical protein
MAGTYPTTPEFQAINLESRHNNVMSETVSGRMQVRTLGGQRWSFTAKYNPMTREEFQPVFAFVMSQQGRFGTFTIVPPVIGDASGDVSGTALVNATTAAGATSVAMDGITGTIKAGDFIKFASHSKVYMVTADRAGAGSVSIEPPLVSGVTDNEAITYDSVPFLMRLANDVQSYNLASNEYYEYELDMIEVL